MKKNPGVPKGFAEAGQIFNVIACTVHPRGCWEAQHPAPSWHIGLSRSPSGIKMHPVRYIQFMSHLLCVTLKLGTHEQITTAIEVTRR